MTRLPVLTALTTAAAALLLTSPPPPAQATTTTLPAQATATTLLIDDYLLTGEGDLDALMGQMAATWRTREVRDVLRRLRAYNAAHAGKVRFAGVEFFATRPLSYDAVTAYVGRAAPGRLAELRSARQATGRSTGKACSVRLSSQLGEPPWDVIIALPAAGDIASGFPAGHLPSGRNRRYRARDKRTI
ncbi:hypothetical protein Misp01_08810 [Microtetraspora sp. NBRC 13810]|uniref:erythromycin esterase family protein n=1 Tax=Microtetraspora sp. NBRC 13810 TaxID=3030990 RepID=UPI0024A02F1B|nr:erythromycin esterase family protein [Microtetraspora sp. NBRC 13810]GLW05751.1 hypothetical protein Misp01_08810 [Microtetraspora sp. NBRC 13810]